ncbi:MAG: hypothetical protein HYS23_01485 [Geobacter sp.]|nr:hypothetical protein [Geobacter sp.]
MKHLVLMTLFGALCGCSSEPSKELVTLCQESLQLEKHILAERKAGRRGPELEKVIGRYKKVNAEINRYHPEKVYHAEKKARGEE